MTNNAGALLQTADADAIQVNRSNSSISFDNRGSVISLNASAGGSQAIDWNAITASNALRNRASGFIEAFKADAVRPGVNGSVINEGTIKAVTSTASSSDGIDGQSNTNGLVINNNGHGFIEGGRNGITAGAADPAISFTLNVTNERNAIIQGDDGAGINIDGFNANEVVTIQNDGRITGNGVTGDGDGVDVDGLVNLTNTGLIKSFNAFSAVPGGASTGVTVGGGTITNSGTIEGDVAPDVNAVGRGMTLAGVDASGTPEPIYANTVVTNSGLIKGQTDSAIAVLGAASGFTVTINNERRGKIEGGGDSAAAIQTAADDDTLNNEGDVIADASDKAIDLGDGNDTLNITGGTIEGDISGGSDTNNCTIDPGAKNFTYTNSISNFNSVEIKSGVVIFLRREHLQRQHHDQRRHPHRREHHRKRHRQRCRAGNRRPRSAATVASAASLIGGGSGRALLAPGTPGQQEATLTIHGPLKFETGGIYFYTFRANSPQLQRRPSHRRWRQNPRQCYFDRSGQIPGHTPREPSSL